MLSERALKKDIKNLKNDVLRLVDHISSTNSAKKGGASLVALKDNSVEQLQNYITELEQAYASTKRSLRDTTSQVKSSIEERPLTAFCAALGIGFLLGAILPTLKGNNHVS